jgi:predicted ester cyclase
MGSDEGRGGSGLGGNGVRRPGWPGAAHGPGDRVSDGLRRRPRNRVLRPFLEGYLAAFGGFRHEVIDWVESGDTIALELHVRGTHTGALPPQGEVEPTGSEVLWESADYVKVREGRIRSWHVYSDNLAVMAQLGLVPATA